MAAHGFGRWVGGLLAASVTLAALGLLLAPAHAVTRPKRCTPTRGPVPPVQELPLTWSGAGGTPGCFFFSGPLQFGRDTQLGGAATMRVSGTSATLDFGGGVRFRGTLSGDQVTLRRTARYEYGGPWETTETISGTYSGNFLRARYGYAECEVARQPCSDSCTIRANVTACARP